MNPVQRSITEKLFYRFFLRHPPDPFVVPPGSSLRFELAFEAQGTATALRFRGYESEGILKF